MLIERLTANHFKYENKLYFASKKALDSYEKRKTIRNLLSRSRLLDDKEASSVKPSLAVILVLECDKEIKILATPSVANSVTMYSKRYKAVKVLYRTERISKIHAQEFVASNPRIIEVKNNFKIRYSHEKTK